MTENLPNLVKQTDSQVQEAQRVSNKMNPKRPTPRNILIKMPKFKDKKRILKAARKRQLLNYKGAPTRLSVDFSTETFQVYLLLTYFPQLHSQNWFITALSVLAPRK